MKPLEYDPDRKWFIEVNEKQLYDIIDCVEDIHRFLAGDMGLTHTSCYIEDSKAMHEFQRQMDKLQPFVTPGLFFGERYDWAGSGCPNKPQKEMIQRTYAIYRNLLHCIEKYRQHKGYNVYQSETLSCGVPLAICYPKDEETTKQKLIN